MTEYEVREAFWRKGSLVEAGAVVSMSDNEAKYLGHVVETKADAVKRREQEAKAAEREAAKAAADEQIAEDVTATKRRAKADG